MSDNIKLPMTKNGSMAVITSKALDELLAAHELLQKERDELQAQLAEANARAAVLVKMVQCVTGREYRCPNQSPGVPVCVSCGRNLNGDHIEGCEFEGLSTNKIDSATKAYMAEHEAMKEEHDAGLGNDKECCYDDVCCDCNPVCWNCKRRVASKKVEDIRNRNTI